MVSLKLSARLPRGDLNGLPSLVSGFERDTDAQQMLVGIVQCGQIVYDARTGDRTLTVMFHALEGIDAATPAGERAHELWLERWSERTGNIPLPLDVGETHE